MLVLICVLAGLVEQSAVIDEKTAAAFLADLQRAVARDDRGAVATLIQFPINVNIKGGFRVPFPDRAALLERYELIFTPEVKAEIARTQPPGRGPVTAATLGFNANGIRVGGVIVAEPTAAGIRITSISVPLGPPGGNTAASPTPDRAASPGKPAGSARRPPERLTLQGRLRMAQRTGTLAPGATNSYTVWAGQGQTLDARLDGVRGRDAIIRIVNLKTGTPLDARSGEGVRRWVGRVPGAAEYRIDVVRTTAAGPGLDYTLVVSVQ